MVDQKLKRDKKSVGKKPQLWKKIPTDYDPNVVRRLKKDGKRE